MAQHGVIKTYIWGRAVAQPVWLPKGKVVPHRVGDGRGPAVSVVANSKILLCLLSDSRWFLAWYVFRP
jgi:hypothetical protein